MTSNIPSISICIPAYKRINYLERLLISISEQTFRDFEVIISDDSTGNEVELLCKKYEKNFYISYHKNDPALGTPANWNKSIKRAKGTWIKLMHDDDWFASENALQCFINAANENKSASFIFSAYKNIQDGNVHSIPVIPRWRLKELKKNPVSLISSNIIGPPSVTFYRGLQDIEYDERLKWLVDIDFYIRFLQKNSFYYIPDILLNVGIHEEQVTQYTFRVPEVEVPEHIILLQKTGNQNLKNIMVFDALWRLVRNLHFRSVDDIKKANFDNSIPEVLMVIIGFQKNIPLRILKLGVISKVMMTACYLKFIKKLQA